MIILLATVAVATVDVSSVACSTVWRSQVAARTVAGSTGADVTVAGGAVVLLRGCGWYYLDRDYCLSNFVVGVLYTGDTGIGV